MPIFPAEESKRKQWFKAFGPTENLIKTHSCVCSRHFKDGNPANGPDKTVGKRFASPKKQWSDKSVRKKKRDSLQDLNRLIEADKQACSSQTPTIPPTPTTLQTPSSSRGTSKDQLLTVSVGEPLESQYLVHELFSDEDDSCASTTHTQKQQQSSRDWRGNTDDEDGVVVNAALLACIEMLE